MTINYIIKSFPHKTETFIVLHIIWLIDNIEKINIYTRSYRGYGNYPDRKLLQDYNVAKYIVSNFEAKSGLKKIIRLLKLLSSLRILKYSIKYYLYKPEASFQNIYNLYIYKNFDGDHVTHVQFNTSINALNDLTRIGYISTTKLIVSFHGYDAFRLTPNKYSTQYKKLYDESVSYVTVNSNYIKKYLVSIGVSAQKIKIIPVGVNLNMFNKTIQIDRLFESKYIQIVTTGRLIQMKGHTHAIRAVKKMKDLGYIIRYYIIGAGLKEYERELFDLVKNLGCEDEIFFLGLKSQQQIKDILLNSHIFWMTSTYDDNTNREEALGVSAIEAQACGLPVIGFKSGGVPEAVLHNKTGLLVEDRNIDELVAKTICLIEDKVKYEEYSKNSRERVIKLFNNDYLFNEYYQLYKSLS
jgi:colanic acid/amylovoran biosynthesis glycosyltransferase